MADESPADDAEIEVTQDLDALRAEILNGLEDEDDGVDENTPAKKKKVLPGRQPAASKQPTLPPVAEEPTAAQQETALTEDACKRWGDPEDVPLEEIIQVVARNKGLTDLEPPGTDLFDELLGLEVLAASWNAISDLSCCEKLASLRILQVSHNRITSLAPLSLCDQLEKLYASTNFLRSLDGLAGLEKLATLSVSANELEGFEAVKDTLTSLPALEVLDVDGNPCVQRPAHKAALRELPNLRELDGRRLKDVEEEPVSPPTRPQTAAVFRASALKPISDPEVDELVRRERTLYVEVENLQVELRALQTTPERSCDTSDLHDLRAANARMYKLEAENRRMEEEIARRKNVMEAGLPSSDADLKFENWKLRRRVEKLQEYIDEVQSQALDDIVDTGKPQRPQTAAGHLHEFLGRLPQPNLEDLVEANEATLGALKRELVEREPAPADVGPLGYPLDATRPSHKGGGNLLVLGEEGEALLEENW
jgi:hypothetical protein